MVAVNRTLAACSAAEERLVELTVRKEQRVFLLLGRKAYIVKVGY